jgi:hypothetical protein
MLTQQAIQAAIPLVLQFEAAGRMLTPVPGSPLDGLCQATYKGELSQVANASPEVGGETERQMLERITSQIDIMTNSNLAAVEENIHSTTMDTWVQVGVDAIKNVITVARSQVSPAVTDLAERVAAKLNEMSPADVAGREIKIRPVNPILDNNQLRSLTSKFIDGTIVEDPPLTLRAADVDANSIREMMLTKVPSLDGVIQTWAANLSDQWLVSLWQTVFAGGRTSVAPFAGRTLREILTDSRFQEDAALAVFLLGNHLIEEGPPEGTVGGISQFEDLVSRYRNQAAAQLERLLEHAEKTSERGYLIASKAGTEIVVNEAIYNKFLDEGGTNEAILGLLVSGDNATTIDEVMEGRARYERLWDQELAYRTETNTAQLFTLKKNILADEFKQQALEDALREGEDMMIANQRVSDLTGQFKLYLETLVLKDLDNLYEVCLKGLCQTRFPDADSYEYLSDIARIMNENPRLDAPSAATVAMLKYIVRWLISQLRVSSN